MMKEIKVLLSNCNNISKLKFVIFSLINSLFETISLALIFSIILLYFQNSQKLDFSIFSLDLKTINLNIITSFFIFIIITKTIYLNFFSWWRNSFVFKFNTEMSNKIFRSYLNRNYEFHLEKDSSEFVRNTFSETRIYSTILDIILKSFSEIVLLTSIIIFLFYYNFYITFLALLINLLIALLFISITKKKLVNFGNLKVLYVKNVLKNIREGYDYIKEIKIYNLKNFFINNFDKNIKEVNRTQKWSSIIIDFPKNSLELLILFFFGIIYFIFSITNFNISNTEIVILIISYGTASLKIIPSSLRLINYYSTISNSMASIKEINKQLIFKKNDDGKDIKIYDKKNFIEIKNLSFFYFNNKKFIFKNLSFKMNTGEIIFLKGESGIGKSTLINLVCGLIKPKDGKITCNNIDISQNLNKWYDGISYVSQGSRLLDETILNNIVFENSIDQKKLDYAIKISNSNKFIDNYDEKLNYIVGENGSNLSGGQAQRIILARAIYKRPKILILDEFTSALDNENEKEIFKSLETLKNDCIILISSHNPIVSSISDKIFELRRSDDDHKKIILEEVRQQVL